MLALLLLAMPAGARGDYEESWETRSVLRTYCNAWGHCERRWVRQRVRVHGYRSATIEHDRPGCRGVFRTVGQQRLSADAAKTAAADAWAGMIRFHLGEKFMELSNARGVDYTCSRSSIKEEGSVATLGQAFYRCELAARPCPAIREGKDND